MQKKMPGFVRNAEKRTRVISAFAGSARHTHNKAPLLNYLQNAWSGRRVVKVSSQANHMSWSEAFELIGKIVTGIATLAGAYWAFVKWRSQDELFPRVNFEVSANFLGLQGEHVVTELVAVLENTGQVPLRIRNFSFKLRGLGKTSSVEKGPEAIRGQLLFPVILDEGEFVPKTWEHTFVYPGVKTEYNFVTAIPGTIAFVRMQGDFEYLGRRNSSHHAARVLAVEIPLQSSSRAIGGQKAREQVESD